MNEDHIKEVLAAHPTAVGSVGELFRLAHLQKFGKLLPPSHAAREAQWWKTHGSVPQYVKEYLDQFKI